MPEDPITDDENEEDDDETDDYRPRLLMGVEDWEAAFEPYKEHSSDAQTLGCKLGVLRTHLNSQTIKCRQAIKALDLAMEVLFPFTSFHDASFDLFIKYTHTGLTFEEEQMVRALGVKF